MPNAEGGGASRSTDPAAGSSAATDVSLRELMSVLFTSERHNTHLLFGFIIALGAFSWSEIQRRLTNLNHEYARIDAAAKQSVSRDTYDANEQQRQAEFADLGIWRKEVDRDRTQSVSREELTRETKVEKRAVTSNGWLWVGGIVGLISLILATIATVISLSNAWTIHSEPSVVTPPTTVTSEP